MRSIRILLADDHSVMRERLAPLVSSQRDLHGFEFERAFIGEVAGGVTPVAIMGGVACNIDTKPDSLEYGLAFCQPLVPRIARDCPFSVVVDRGLGAELLWDFTADPWVVAAARRFADMSSRGAVLSVGSVL